MEKFNGLIFFLFASFFLLTGCELDNSSDSEQSAQGQGNAAPPDELDMGVAREPVPIAGLTVVGQYTPKPDIVRYEFVFADGTILKFRENHKADFWGGYPEAGWGEVVNPDGTSRGVDVNKIVRKGGLSIAKTPVTTLEHGNRMYWMADGGRKRVDIFQDGWHHLVEGAVLATQSQIGIEANLVSCFVKVEKHQ